MHTEGPKACRGPMSPNVVVGHEVLAIPLPKTTTFNASSRSISSTSSANSPPSAPHDVQGRVVDAYAPVLWRQSLDRNLLAFANLRPLFRLFNMEILGLQARRTVFVRSAVAIRLECPLVPAAESPQVESQAIFRVSRLMKSSLEKFP